MGCAQSDPAGVSSPSGANSNGNNNSSNSNNNSNSTSNNSNSKNSNNQNGTDDSSDQAAARAMQQRRRLSVQMTGQFDANAVGGYADEAATGANSGATKQFYQTAARSKKGYVPYNSRKQNQVL